MKINTKLLEKIKNSDSKLLVVTKYFDKEKTQEIMDFFEKNYNGILFWFWENRVSSLKEKNLIREKTHFIWNVQTKEIKQIVKFTSCIHSVCKLKHLEKIQEVCENENLEIDIFIQINLDKNKDSWIAEDEIPDFLKSLKICKNIRLIWFSWIWKYEFNDEEKINEFDKLIKIRNKYLKKWLISAWTSVDYKFALDKKIDVIRIGSWILDNN